MAPNGYAYEVVGNGAQNLKCPVCKALIRDCVELPCAHTMCKNCVDFISNQAEKSEDDTVCPTCQTIYIMDWVKESKAMDRIITTSVKIRCPQVQLGCNWQGDILTVKEHETKCIYKTIECSNLGCNASIIRNDMQKHLNICECRVEKCKYCKTENSLNLMEEHYKVCDLYPANCPNRICKFEGLRKDLVNHLTNDCEHQEIQCQFYEAGCITTVKRRSMNRHLEQNVNEHIALLFHNNKEMEKAHQETKMELADAQERLVKTTIILKEFNERLIEMKRELDATKIELAEMRQHRQQPKQKVVGEESDSSVIIEENEEDDNVEPARKFSSSDESKSGGEKERKISPAVNTNPLVKKPKKKVSPFINPRGDMHQGPRSPIKKKIPAPLSPVKVERSESSASSSSGSSDTSGNASPPKRISPVQKDNTSPIPIMSKEMIAEDPKSPTGTLENKKRQAAIKPIITRPNTPLQSIIDAMYSSPPLDYPTHFHALMSSMETDQFYVVNGDLLIKINTRGCLRPYSVVYIQPWEERRRNVFHDMKRNRRTRYQSERVSIEASPQLGIIKLLVNCNLEDTVASVVCTQQNTQFLPAYLENWGWGFNVPSGIHRTAFYTQEHILIKLRQRQYGVEQMLSGM